MWCKARKAHSNRLAYVSSPEVKRAEDLLGAMEYTSRCATVLAAFKILRQSRFPTQVSERGADKAFDTERPSYH